MLTALKISNFDMKPYSHCSTKNIRIYFLFRFKASSAPQNFCRPLFLLRFWFIFYHSVGAKLYILFFSNVYETQFTKLLINIVIYSFHLIFNLFYSPYTEDLKNLYMLTASSLVTDFDGFDRDCSDVLLTGHLSIILVINQHNAQILVL